MRSLLTHSFVHTLCSLSTLAVKIPFHVSSPGTEETTPHVPRQSSSNGTVPVGNTQNTFYYTNVTLGGRQISVMLDTGRYPFKALCVNHLIRRSFPNSSDLWVTGSVPGAQDTGKSVTLSYAVGNAAGTCSHLVARVTLMVG
jgi:hypothetical protein